MWPLVVLVGGYLLLGTQSHGQHEHNERGESAFESAENPLNLFQRRRVDLATLQQANCPNAPFQIPAAGYIGLYYNDPSRPYNTTRRHQGVDIFVDEGIGVVPVYAVYDGYVTREAWWPSALIQRIPNDPLQPDRQIWVYYTHMADENGNDFIEPVFDLGVREVFVAKGTLLGYVGEYDGNQPSRIHPHLHLSVVLDDGFGRYTNELDISNTLDPSPYLGIAADWRSDLACSS